MTDPSNAIDLGALQREVEAAQKKYNAARAAFRHAESRVEKAESERCSAWWQWKYALDALNEATNRRGELP